MNRTKIKVLKSMTLAAISIIAGSSLLFRPESTPLIILRAVGIWWMLEGVLYILIAVQHIIQQIENERRQGD